MVSDITVWVDGTKVPFYDTHPIKIRGRVMVPLRGVFQQMEATVNWDAATRVVTAHKEGYDIELSLNNPRAHVNGKTVILDVPATEFHDRVVVPIRFIGEALGAHVKWEKETGSVLIETSPPPR